jgi:membrane-bound serine protease (ClpP class)
MIVALGRVATSLILAVAGAFVALRFLPRLPFARRLVLDSDMGAEDGYVSAPQSGGALVGRTGTALSPMRPAGIADIDGRRLDVVSDGEFIDAGSRIEVTSVNGNRIVIRRITPPEEKLT